MTEVIIVAIFCFMSTAFIVGVASGVICGRSKEKPR